jgi:hypothetical protein
MQDFMGTFDGMEGQDIFKVIGGAVAGVGLIAALPIFGAIGSVTASGAVLGAALGAGAGMTVVANDEEERRAIYSRADAERQQQWADSVQVRQKLAGSARTMEGYCQSLKLAYGLVAASFTCREGYEDKQEQVDTAKKALDGIFAVWLPADLKEELKLMFQNLPTFYDVGLMIRDAFKQGELDGAAFIDATTNLLNHLDEAGVIEKSCIEDEWNAFRVGLITNETKIRNT